MINNFIKELIFKFHIYGPKYFVIFSIIEFFRIIKRKIGYSFSQIGEDRKVLKILGKKKISYIEIGANDPIKFSNTYLFYRAGGRGVLVEPNIKLIKKSRKLRPKDISINAGVGIRKTVKTFYLLNPDVGATFDKRSVKKALDSGCILEKKIKVKIISLKNIFEEYLKKDNVDLLSTDTEGADLEVLKSNDWNKHRAKVMIVEVDTPEIKKFLKDIGYKLVDKTETNGIYVDIRK